MYKKGEEPNFIKSKKPTEKMHNAYVLIYERDRFIDHHRMMEQKERGEVINYQDYVQNPVTTKDIQIQDYISQEVGRANAEYWMLNKLFCRNFLTTMQKMLAAIEYPKMNEYKEEW